MSEKRYNTPLFPQDDGFGGPLGDLVARGAEVLESAMAAAKTTHLRFLCVMVASAMPMAAAYGMRFCGAPAWQRT